MTVRPGSPIAIVCPRYAAGTGGVERYVERLATGLHARGIAVEIVTTDPHASQPTVLHHAGIPVRSFPTLGGDGTYYASPDLLRWLRRHAGRYALLHAHNLHTLLPLSAAWAARKRGVPLVLTAHWHGTGHTRLRRALHVPYRPAARWMVRGADAVVSNSQAEAELLRRDFGDRLPITVVPEGIELPAISDETGSAGRASTMESGQVDPDGLAGSTTILSVGRLETYKGVERVVRALPDLPRDIRLVVIGQGPARDTIAAAAMNGGVADRVVLRGRVPDEELREWYRRAGVFASLSEHESFGLTVLEAAAAGAPVVASDIPAHRESSAMVPPGRITLVPADANGPIIARAITTSIARGRISDVSDWGLPSWDALVDRTLAVYRTVAAGVGSGPAPGDASRD